MQNGNQTAKAPVAGTRWTEAEETDFLAEVEAAPRGQKKAVIDKWAKKRGIKEGAVQQKLVALRKKTGTSTAGGSGNGSGFNTTPYSKGGFTALYRHGGMEALDKARAALEAVTADRKKAEADAASLMAELDKARAQAADLERRLKESGVRV